MPERGVIGLRMCAHTDRRRDRERVRSSGPPLRRTVRRFPDVDLPQSDDPHVLRSQILQMKAKMKEYASKAEAACYEVRSALLRGAGPARGRRAADNANLRFARRGRSRAPAKQVNKARP